MTPLSWVKTGEKCICIRQSEWRPATKADAQFLDVFKISDPEFMHTYTIAEVRVHPALGCVGIILTELSPWAVYIVVDPGTGIHNFAPLQKIDDEETTKAHEPA